MIIALGLAVVTGCGAAQSAGGANAGVTRASSILCFRSHNATIDTKVRGLGFGPALVALKPYFVTFRDLQAKTYPTFPGTVKSQVRIEGIVFFASSTAGRKHAAQLFLHLPTNVALTPDQIEPHHLAFVEWQDRPNAKSKDRLAANVCLGSITV